MDWTISTPSLRIGSSRQNPQFTETNGTHALVPGDLWTIYDVNPLLNASYSGTGQKVVVVGQSNINLSDVTLFRQHTGLPVNNPQIVWAAATLARLRVRPAKSIWIWNGPAAWLPTPLFTTCTRPTPFDATQYAIDNNIAPVITSSYTECEAQVSAAVTGAAAFFEALAQQGNALGITWVVSSGDQGAAACESATAD